MNKYLENIKQAKESFNRILDNKIYANVIRDDKHLSILLNLLENGNYRKILDIGTGTRYAFHHFPNVANAVQQMKRILVKGEKYFFPTL